MFLKKFLAGIVFATTIAPILDSVASAVMTGLEVVKGKWALKVAEYNQQLQKMGDEPSSTTHVIGFAMPTEEEDDYEEED